LFDLPCHTSSSYHYLMQVHMIYSCLDKLVKYEDMFSLVQNYTPQFLREVMEVIEAAFYMSRLINFIFLGNQVSSFARNHMSQ
jgi:hypothetical protein